MYPILYAVVEINRTHIEIHHITLSKIAAEQSGCAPCPFMPCPVALILFPALLPPALFTLPRTVPPFLPLPF